MNANSRQAEARTNQLLLGPLRAALFLLLPNDLVWSRLLSSEERQRLLSANVSDNGDRDDFTPEFYQRGNNFESNASRAAHVDGKWIIRFLEKHMPASVVECGPGSGFHTRTIVEHASVSRYAGIDINSNFIAYLKERLKPYAETKDLDFTFFVGDVKQVDCPPVDAVVFSSSLHHIPDREAVFRKLAKMVKRGGFVCCVEPTHYLPRLMHLWRKITTPGYLKGMGDGTVSVATHHFCTWREFKRLAQNPGDFFIHEVHYDGYRGALIPRILGKLARTAGVGWPIWLATSFPVRLFSTRMMIVFKRR